MFTTTIIIGRCNIKLATRNLKIGLEKDARMEIKSKKMFAVDIFLFHQFPTKDFKDDHIFSYISYATCDLILKSIIFFHISHMQHVTSSSKV